MRLMGRTGWAVLVGWLWLTLVPSLSAKALDVPPLSGHVVDLAQVLPPETVKFLSSEIQAHEAKTSNQVAVLIVPSLEGEPLFDFSHRVATSWKLGRHGTDNGVLLLIAIKDRKIRLEVGYGLEGVLTDARSAQIIRNEIVPRFRAGDVPMGVKAGVQAVLNTIEGTYSVPERPITSRSEGDAFANALLAVIVGVVVGSFFSRKSNPGADGRRWSFVSRCSLDYPRAHCGGCEPGAGDIAKWVGARRRRKATGQRQPV